MPMSSPMITTMFGRCPVAVAGCAWAGDCATSIVEPSVVAAASVVLPSRILRRFRLLGRVSFGLVSLGVLSGLFTVLSPLFSVHGLRLARTMQRKLTWLVEVSTGSA